MSSFESKELGKIASRFKVRDETGIAVSFTGICIDVGFKWDCQFQDDDLA